MELNTNYRQKISIDAFVEAICIINEQGERRRRVWHFKDSKVIEMLQITDSKTGKITYVSAEEYIKTSMNKDSRYSGASLAFPDFLDAPCPSG